MESYQEFLDRIDTFEKQELQLGNGHFSVNPSVALKVGEDYLFREFYGDTVVFDLDEKEKTRIQEYAAVLHQAVPECFCERLADHTFHMTLHDLSNSSVPEEVSVCMETNALKLKAILKAHPIMPQTIQMRSKAIFNMVNTSLVLGLYPADAQEYLKLMALYQLVNSVKELPYPLTPHITLAYYRRDGFGRDSAERLEQTVNTLNRKPLEFTLHTERLVYQHFKSMNDYRTIWHVHSSSPV